MIGIYSIFVDKYVVYYEDFIKNMKSNFLPEHEKIFYIVTDQKDLPSYHENTVFLYIDKIGWPYETLYRFKYFLEFPDVKANIIYFFNSNAFCMNVLGNEVLPNDTGYVFVEHNGYSKQFYQTLTFEKNPKSTAYIPFSETKDYKYIESGLFGANKREFLELCTALNKNIDIDEQNSYIAVWHDESHLNHYANVVLDDKYKLLDASYYVPEEKESQFKNINVMYFNDDSKINTKSVNSTNGSIIQNKWNEHLFSTKVSFHVLIATVGRPTLQRMLNSLSCQLEESDCLTIVYDGHSVVPNFDVSKFKCPVNQFFEPEALKFWGHGIRNKYASLLEKRDFVMHADDDDIYVENAFGKLRMYCQNKNTLYVARMFAADKSFVPRRKIIECANIGTPCGIIPFELNSKGTWGTIYGGDGMFYKDLEKEAESLKFLNVLIYQVMSPANKNS